MAAGAKEVGERIERLLATLTEGEQRDTAEELVGLLVEMYGEGLANVVGMLDEEAVGRLTADPLVESLLLLHDLHPVDVDARIQRALDEVRPYLGSHAGGVTYLGVDADGVAQLRLEGSCDGCASSAQTVQLAIEGAIEEAAPELAGIEVAGVASPTAAEQPLLQIGMGPPGAPPAPTGPWARLPELETPAAPVRVEVSGVPVLVCSAGGSLYAYRDACASCSASLAGGVLNGNLLTCPSCGARFNVRLAGRGMSGTAHLSPLPLLTDDAGARVAVPS